VIRKPRLSVVTTSWDDGHPQDLRLAELLARYELSGTFYVPREASWPVITPPEIRRLSSKFEIGAHTLNHRSLAQLGDEEAGEQLTGSRNWIEEVTGKPCRSFCFPGGKFRRGQLCLVREAGYLSARTTELLSTEFPRRVEGIAVIPTTIQVFPHSPLTYGKNSLKRWSLGNLARAIPRLHRGDWSDLAVMLFERTLKHGGVFHLWGHSWEIDDQQQWGRLEQLLAVIAENKDKVTGVTNSELGTYAD
jgi:peptidoglycan/xylan/chitin deacetylase (PgdA/CDA1 family)